METTDKLGIVERAFRQLQSEGKVKTQGDFARLLGVSQNTISAAKNGDPRYLTPSLISKIDYLLEHPGNESSSKTQTKCRQKLHKKRPRTGVPGLKIFIQWMCFHMPLQR